MNKTFVDFFSLLAQFFFPTSETDLDYYHQNVNVRVASPAAEQLKTWDPRKLENYKKILEMLESDGEYPGGHPTIKFGGFAIKITKNQLKKHSIAKPILLNFVNLSTTFCPRLYFKNIETPQAGVESVKGDE